MKILIAGGAGFIGSHLSDRLLADGHEVWCFDNLDTGFEANLATSRQQPRHHFLTGDIRDLLPDIAVDRVYNLACPASPRHYQRDPVGTLRTSIIGTLNALDYCHANGARLLLASTSEIYGDPNVHPQQEDYVGAVNCIGPRACYEEGKRAAETACVDYHRQHGVEVRIARLFNTYGPRMGINDGRVIPNFVTQAILGRPLSIYGSGTQTRSFCYIDDMVEALVRLMEAPGGCVGPLNLGNPAELSIRGLAERIIAKTGSPSPMAFEALPQDDPRVRRPDIRRATALLDWTPSISLDEGLDRTIAWYRERLQSIVQPARLRARDGQSTVVIIGGGPAGLTAAYSLQTQSSAYHPIVLEAASQVGGIARTESYKGYRFDIGGHRFFTRVARVEALWREVLPNDFLRRPRLSRIFYRGKYYAYPLKLLNALLNIGVFESCRIMLSYAKWRLRPYPVENTFEQWVTNRFGGRLYWHFFKTYTEKVWGIPGDAIGADWAAQRIKNLSLRKAVWNAISGANDTTSLIEAFDYPRLGPGMMWEAFQRCVEQRGGEVRLNTRVIRIRHDADSIRSVEVGNGDDQASGADHLEADQFISSMPLSALVAAMAPPAPAAIQAAARRLKYRDFVMVALILDRPDPFPDNWIYIHSPKVQVGRIQNFRAWSEAMAPDPNRSSIGMEYFCQQGDALWAMDDAALIRHAASELDALGLAPAAAVVDGSVIRQSKAYPVYDHEYQEALGMIRGWLANFRNLQVVGRNGMHRYNNQDHSMLTAMMAVDNILGGNHDLWSVNVDKEYHETADVVSGPAHVEAAGQTMRARAA